MPLYDYQCEKCTYDFEASKPVDERESCQCPKCGEQAKHVIKKTVPFILYGEWSNTGYSDVRNAAEKYREENPL